MEFLEKLFGDPVEIVKKVLTHASGALVKPILVEFFNSGIDARSRQELGARLVAAGAALEKGEVAKASDNLAAVIGEIRL